VAKKKKAAKPEARSRGLTATTLTSGHPPAAIESLRRAIVEDGGEPLVSYRDPVGGRWQVLAALPVDVVQPTPFQRDLSTAHAARLADVIDKIDRFLDPIIAVRGAEGGYWTPNGHHRLAAPSPSSRSCCRSPRPPTASSP
jgi:ParB family chromosome partitioning protein